MFGKPLTINLTHFWFTLNARVQEKAHFKLHCGRYHLPPHPSMQSVYSPCRESSRKRPRTPTRYPMFLWEARILRRSGGGIDGRSSKTQGLRTLLHCIFCLALLTVWSHWWVERILLTSLWIGRGGLPWLHHIYHLGAGTVCPGVTSVYCRGWSRRRRATGLSSGPWIGVSGAASRIGAFLPWAVCCTWSLVAVGTTPGIGPTACTIKFGPMGHVLWLPVSTIDIMRATTILPTSAVADALGEGGTRKITISVSHLEGGSCLVECWTCSLRGSECKMEYDNAGLCPSYTTFILLLLHRIYMHFRSTSGDGDNTGTDSSPETGRCAG
jgi:hypothetical protein